MFVGIGLKKLASEHADGLFVAVLDQIIFD